MAWTLFYPKSVRPGSSTVLVQLAPIRSCYSSSSFDRLLRLGTWESANGGMVEWWIAYPKPPPCIRWSKLVEGALAGPGVGVGAGADDGSRSEGSVWQSRNFSKFIPSSPSTAVTHSLSTSVHSVSPDCAPQSSQTLPRSFSVLLQHQSLCLCLSLASPPSLPSSFSSPLFFLSLPEANRRHSFLP